MQAIPYLVVVLLILVFLVLPSFRQLRRDEQKARAAQKEAREQGLAEPVSLRPHVDVSVCIASAACVQACPEQSVLELIDGHAQIVQGAHCVGHGACERSCPVDAIQLVFGSERRGIDLPTLRPDFQSDVPGIYIAGELGGMGLLANSVEQGVQAAENLARHLPPCPEGGVDVAIVGAGPAGLSAGMWCQQKGISYVLLEQGEFGGAIRHYPRQKLVMTRPLALPGYKKVNLKQATKEQLIEILEDAVRTTGLRVDCSERVLEVPKNPSGGFFVKTSVRTIKASKVLLAVGRRGTPRRLEKPGEEASKVAYRLVDPERYQHNHILVVGGGDSAVEAACSLAEQPGNRVTLSYRGANLSRPKPANRERAHVLAERGDLSLALSSEVASIEEDRVFLTQEGEERVLPNDFVFVLVGGVLPVAFLRSVGISFQTHYGLRVDEPSSAGPT